jgi:hypothetical protein
MNQYNIYYYKYIKYKTKYINYLNKIINNIGGNINNLYLLFITEDLISHKDDNQTLTINKKRLSSEISSTSNGLSPQKKKQKREPKLPKKYNEYEMNITPNILKNLTPKSKERFIEDIKIDDNLRSILDKIEEIEDPDYIQYENYGKLIESWIADNMSCPCCNKKTLRRYQKNNMPVIDVVCINPEHTINTGVKFFQIKTSNGAPFKSKPYFSYNKFDSESNIIHVGSKKYGESIHNIKTTDDDDMKLLIGYICILFNEQDNNLKINLNKSFIVLPQYAKAQTKLLLYNNNDNNNDNDWYYKYINNDDKHPIIKFNLKNNKIVNPESLLNYHLIPKNYIIETNSIKNPLNLSN